MRRPSLAYVDGLIAAYHAGQAGRDVHLGYWDDPPALSGACEPGEFIAAQARLTARLIALASPRDGERVLDVACGLGGALAMLAALRSGLALIGLNIDPRQLQICRSVAPPARGSLSLVAADACSLPFAAASFDTVLCIEAMFHFSARRSFLAEAARVLRPGGSLLLSDILLRDPGAAAPWPGDAIVAALRRDYGPWPMPWCDHARLLRWARAVGLSVEHAADWTAETRPSYRITAPDPHPELQQNPDAGRVLRWLHAAGWLTYQIARFRRLPS